jgi:hypothetical protein
MKKIIFILCPAIIVLSITAFSFSNLLNPAVNNAEAISFSKPFTFNNGPVGVFPNRLVTDFAYDVDSRYLTTITKEEIDKVRSMKDIMPKKWFELSQSTHSISVSIIDHNYRAVAIETGNSELFTTAQLNLLQTAPYSSNILIKAKYQEKDFVTGALYYKYATPHLTIIPEKETQYVEGKDELIKYLRESSKEKIGNITMAKLKPGKIGFTITNTATISNVKLLSASGYPSIDSMMLELITTIPGKWNSASNNDGEKVGQELVFSFGLIGC